VTVRLEPCGSARARFVDAQGRPVAGHRPWLLVVLTPGVHPTVEALEKGLLYAEEEFADNLARPHSVEVRTDAEGRVTLPCLIPGATYRIMEGQGKSKDFTAEAGKTLDLGDVAADQPE
jgi:hypothetical protein